MKQLFLGIDIGTSSIKHALVSVDGTVLYQDFYSLSVYTNNQISEIDLGNILDQVRAIIELASKQVKAKELFIGFSLQRSAVCAWDVQSKKAISPLLLWNDNRTKEFFDLLRQKDIELISKKTKLPALHYYAAGKIRHLSRKFTDPTFRIGTLDSFLLDSLIDEFYTEDTMASRTLLYDINVMQWDKSLCNLFSIDQTRLAPIEASIAQRKHKSVINIMASLGDQQAGLLFADKVCAMPILNCGTVTSLLFPTSKLQLVEGCVPRIYYSYQKHLQKEYAFCLEGMTHSPENVFSLLFSNRFQQFTLNTLDDLYSLKRDQAYPVLYCGEFAEQTPFWNEPTNLISFSEKIDLQSFVTLLIEHAAFSIAMIFEETISKSKLNISRLLFSGGYSSSRSLQKILSALLPIPLYQLYDSRYQAAYGAAVAASMAVDSKIAFNMKSQIFALECDPKLIDYYQQRYELWKDLRNASISNQKHEYFEINFLKELYAEIS